ncbi:MAG: hypothetical protein HYS83_01420 [Candidatus Blackburnbacteria bacterium]|nr:hypothetical protein [Candidatus Blackburnbacteria bacterium]
MSKNALIAITAVVLVLALAAGFLFYKPGGKIAVPTTGKTSQDKGGDPEAVQADQTYKDEAGFSFSYPKGIIVADTTPDDISYYSMVSLKKDGEELTVSMKDTAYKDIADWLNRDKGAPQGAGLAGAVSLGGIPAKQYSADEKLFTVAIDQGILYLIQGPKDGEYWDSVHDAVVSTLAFSKPGQAAGGTGSGGDVVYEEEEVVE